MISNTYYRGSNWKGIAKGRKEGRNFSQILCLSCFCFVRCGGGGGVVELVLLLHVLTYYYDTALTPPLGSIYTTLRRFAIAGYIENASTLDTLERENGRGKRRGRGGEVWSSGLVIILDLKKRCRVRDWNE